MVKNGKKAGSVYHSRPFYIIKEYKDNIKKQLNLQNTEKYGKIEVYEEF